jgi:Uma2 family endonuclease
MSALPKLSAQAYLEQERLSDTKHEFYNGEIFAMSGGSPAHNLIGANLIRELGVQLKKRPCRVYTSDQRVQLNDGYVYPDVSVACGKPEFFDKDNLTNPIVIIEVLSSSTADYDAGGKFARYRQLSSLQEYILVAQDRAHVMHYVKQAVHQWTLRDYFEADEFELPNLECRLDLAEIYAKVFE